MSDPVSCRCETRPHGGRAAKFCSHSNATLSKPSLQHRALVSTPPTAVAICTAPLRRLFASLPLRFSSRRRRRADRCACMSLSDARIARRSISCSSAAVTSVTAATVHPAALAASRRLLGVASRRPLDSPTRLSDARPPSPPAASVLEPPAAAPPLLPLAWPEPPAPPTTRSAAAPSASCDSSELDAADSSTDSSTDWSSELSSKPPSDDGESESCVVASSVPAPASSVLLADSSAGDACELAPLLAAFFLAALPLAAGLAAAG